MSNLLFVFGLILLGVIVYVYTNKKWKKREKEFDEYAYKLQKEFVETSPAIETGRDYYKTVQDFFIQKGYELTKHANYVTDFIAKKDKEILFIRIQSPQDKKDITAQVFQHFIGQTVLQVLDDKEHDIKWTYVCSKMMCDKSARVFINSYENKLKFELIEA